MKKHFGRILFATLCLTMASCGVHTNGTKATENSTTDVTQVVEAGAVCGAPSAAGASDCGADGEPSAVEAGQTGDAQNSEAQRGHLSGDFGQVVEEPGLFAVCHCQ